MRVWPIYILFVLFGSSMWGCSKDSLSPEEFVQYVRNPESGLRMRKEFDSFYFDLQYEPIEYAALMRSGLEGLNNGEFAKEKESLKGLQYFQLQLGSVLGKEFLRTGISSMDEYHGRLEYYTSHVQEDIKLITGLDTLPCVMHHFERTYKISPYSTLIIAFEETLGVMPRTLVYNDRALGLGIIKFTITENSLKRLPSLKV